MYHFKLCRAILVGFRDQLRRDGTYSDGFVGMLEAGSAKEQMLLPVFNLTCDDGQVLKVQIDFSIAQNGCRKLSWHITPCSWQ